MKITTKPNADIKNDNCDEYLYQQQYNNKSNDTKKNNPANIKNDNHDEYLYPQQYNNKSYNTTNNYPANMKNDDHDSYLYHRWNNNKSNNKNNVDCFPQQDRQPVPVLDIINTKEEQRKNNKQGIQQRAKQK